MRRFGSRQKPKRLLKLRPHRGNSALRGLKSVEPDAHGNVPAIAYAGASLARKLIAGRTRASWSQAELARRAGVRPETVNRIERGKNTPDERTFAKLVGALKRVGVRI